MVILEIDPPYRVTLLSTRVFDTVNPCRPTAVYSATTIAFLTHLRTLRASASMTMVLLASNPARLMAGDPNTLV